MFFVAADRRARGTPGPRSSAWRAAGQEVPRGAPRRDLLYYTILYYTILYYTILHSIV